MATYAARRLTPMVANTAGIVAVELLAAAQGVDFRAPLRTSQRLGDAMALVRTRAAFWSSDRAFAPDLAAVRELVESGAFVPYADGVVV
jgi:histidine ammonia-lyase